MVSDDVFVSIEVLMLGTEWFVLSIAGRFACFSQVQFTFV